MKTIAKVFDKKLYLSQQGLAALLGVSLRQIGTYKKYDEPLLPDKKDKVFFYETWSALSWYHSNIDQRKSASTKGTRFDSAQEDETDLHIDEISEGEAKRRNEIAKLKLAEIKIKKENDVLIDAEDVDRAMSEQAVLYESSKKNDEKILPVLLENRSRDEIAKLLYAHNMKDSKSKHKLVNKVFKSSESFYDIAQVIFDAMTDGVGPEDIIENISSLQAKAGIIG